MAPSSCLRKGTHEEKTHLGHVGSNSRFIYADGGDNRQRGSGGACRKNLRGISSFTPPRVQVPIGWKLVPVPPSTKPTTGNNFKSTTEEVSEDPPSQTVCSTGVNVCCETEDVEEDRGNVDATVSDNALQIVSERKRLRRQTKRIEEEEGHRRERAGLKPFVVQVNSEGIIDSGCMGHLKWQENIRDFTPRMLDMSTVVYEDQKESSLHKLKECLFNKFEFIDNEVTSASFDKMIKTWLRKYRERVKRLYGSRKEPPPRSLIGNGML